MKFAVRQLLALAALFPCLLCCMHCAVAGFLYSGTSPGSVPWPGGIIPYEFATNLTAAQKQTYLDGLREWELAGNVQLIPRSNQVQYVLFKYDPFGPNLVSGNNPQTVEVNSLSRGQVCHEMGHSLGFTHEHIRPDRDNFLTVLTNNISSGNEYWFDIDPAGVTNGLYDFESVMHFARDLFSVQPGVLDVLQPKPGYERFQPRLGNYALSAGDRATLSYLYGPPATPLTNIVITTADGGPGSLRAALYYAMDHPGTTITFNIPPTDPGHSNGVYTIRLTGYLPPVVTDGTVIDGATQPGFNGKPLIVVDGSSVIPEAYGNGSFTGLLLYAADCEVRSLSFQNFNWNGITLLYADATNNTIAGCWCGLDFTGTNAAPNAYQGILVTAGASRNLIGGTNVADRNVLSGNLQYGVWISGSNTTGNSVLGSHVGTDASGTLALSNAFGGLGLFDQTRANVIGGSAPGAGNVISGNTDAGIWIVGSGVESNVVAGNLIGLDATGTNALPNSFVGIYVLDGAKFNRIGGTQSNERNIISGNYAEGVRFADPGTMLNTALGNFVGTDSSGLAAVPNGFAGIAVYNGATSNVIGGTISGARNLIGGNAAYGVIIGEHATDGNRIEGNWIGVNASGTAALPNYVGVIIQGGAQSNSIGGAGAGNLLSGNIGPGIYLTDTNTSGNRIQGNWVGTSVSGTNALPNGSDGILVLSGASGNIIGGNQPSLRNVISGNTYTGVALSSGANDNIVQGNFIGTATDGSTPLGNGIEGVFVSASRGNRIGGAGTGEGNVISANTYRGVALVSAESVSNVVQGNLIGTMADGISPLGNLQHGILIGLGASNNVIGLNASGTGAGNTIAHNAGMGVQVQQTSTGNTIRGNRIHSNGGLGINLAGGSEDSYSVTANDNGDADTGPNGLQNFPAIANAAAWGPAMHLSGTLNSAGNRAYAVDFYRNSVADSSGYGEGREYLGAVTVTTDASGSAMFDFGVSGVATNDSYSATATDLVTGGTSEFSISLAGNGATTGPASPTLQLNSGMPVNGIGLDLSIFPGWHYRLQGSTNLAVWVDLTNFIANVAAVQYTDSQSTNWNRRFYRLVSP